MSPRDEIKKVFQEWGKETALELKESAQQALARGGRKNPNSISLEFDESIKVEGGNVILEIRARKKGKPAKYWRAIEEGRTPGKKAPPSDVLGKVWQNENNIDPRVILLQIQAKRRKALNVPERKFKALKKTLSFDKAAKQVSFLFARSIGKKGIKPKPFLGEVLTNEQIAKLRQRLTPHMGANFKLIIKGLE